MAAQARKVDHYLCRHRFHPHTQSMSPHLPVTADEIAAAAIGAAEAGAADHPPACPRPEADGRPVQTPEGLSCSFLPRIKQASRIAVVNVTTGGAPAHDGARSGSAPAAALKPGGRLAQHGLDELRSFSRCSAVSRI